jgi:drug/metabolite transporter (DMT)-like permease
MHGPAYPCLMSRSAALPSSPAPAAAMTRQDVALYAATLLFWGTSWIALRAQLGVVAPEVSLLWRFGIAAAVMWAWVAVRGDRLRYPASEHLRFAGAGLCLFSLNFTFFYYGGITTPSGLLAVVFSLASVFNLILGALLLRQPIEPRVALGGLVGFSGVGLLFWPQIAGAGFDAAAILGLALCVLGTLIFCLGNMISTVIQRRGIALLPANAWAMTYGTGVVFVLSLVRGQAFVVEPTWQYLGSLVWLAVGATVIAFATYLTLLRRIGAARAGYITVMFPLVALAISTAVEGYAWTPMAAAGVACALLGNVLVLTRPTAR